MSEAGSAWADDRSVCRESLFACGRVLSVFGDDVRPFEQDASHFEEGLS
jgi:hypothetical protein